jgi:hypothetical protein
MATPGQVVELPDRVVAVVVELCATVLPDVPVVVVCQGGRTHFVPPLGLMFMRRVFPPELDSEFEEYGTARRKASFSPPRYGSGCMAFVRNYNNF